MGGDARQSLTVRISEQMAEQRARAAARRRKWAAGEIPLAEVFGGAVADNWGAVVVLAVPVVALGVVFRHDFAWGDVPTWVLAALTLGAFGAAAFAGVVAFDLLRVENRRDAQAAETAGRAQAGKVAAWYGFWRSEITYTGDPSSLARSWPHWGAVIRNASDLPVYDVRVSFCVAVSLPPGAGPRWRAEERYSSPEPILAIPPGGEEKIDIPEDVLERERVSGAGDGPRWLVGIRFTDADGRDWLRAPSGQLRPV